MMISERNGLWTYPCAAVCLAALIGCSPPPEGERKGASPPSAAASPAPWPLYEWNADSKTPHQIGSFDGVSGAWVAKPGEAGYLVAGPYLPLPLGRYKVTFQLEFEAPDGASPGTVDVNAFTAAIPSKVIATKALEGPPGLNILDLDFEVTDASAAHEFRVISNGKGRLAYRKTSLTSLKATAR